MRRLIASAVLMLSAFAANAGTATSYGKVTAMQFWVGHEGVLIVHQNMINPDGCPRSDQYLLRQTNVFFKEIYAQILSAHNSGKRAQFHVEGCHQGFPVVIVSATAD